MENTKTRYADRAGDRNNNSNQSEWEVLMTIIREVHDGISLSMLIQLSRVKLIPGGSPLTAQVEKQIENRANELEKQGNIPQAQAILEALAKI